MPPYALVVRVLDAEAGDAASNLAQTILATAESWQPSSLLSDGLNEFHVLYADPGESFVSALSVTDGSITWSDSLFAPPSYPEGTPLLALGSSSAVTFTVPEPAAGSLASAAMLCLLFLRSRTSACRQGDASS